MVMTSNVKGFNYALLDEDATRLAQINVQAIHVLVQRTTEHLIEIGCRLREVKGSMPRIHFAHWCQIELRWSLRRAEELMKISERFGDLKCVGQFQLEALSLLSRSTISHGAVSEAIQKAESGQVVTSKLATELIQKNRPQGYVPGKPGTGPAPLFLERLRQYLAKLRLLETADMELAAGELQKAADELMQTVHSRNGNTTKRTEPTAVAAN